MIYVLAFYNTPFKWSVSIESRFYKHVDCIKRGFFFKTWHFEMREVISHRWEKKTIYIEYEWSFTLEIELVMLYSENVTSELQTKPKNQIYFMNVLKMKLLIKKQNRPSSFNFNRRQKYCEKVSKLQIRVRCSCINN